MDRTRCKRPSDVNEALSSMLWTPYDDVAGTSVSTDGLTDDERRRGERKFQRYSNPLPSSIHWPNTHATCSQSMTMKYSFPFNGNCFPSDVSLHNFPSTATKRTVSKTITERNYGQTFNTSMFEPTIVRSFTDDFYHYQNHKKYECQSTYKNYKSQPLIQLDSLLYPSSSSNEIIDKCFEAPSIGSTTITTEYYGDKLFNHQMVNTEGNKWQHGKVGNMGDLYSYVHKGSVKKQEKLCTNTTLNAEEKSRKVTQPPNVIQSYSTLNSRNNKLGGNEYTNQEENCSQTQTKAISKTLLSDSMVATSRASRSEDSNECRVLDLCGDNRRDVDKYRLSQKVFTQSVDMNVHDSQVSQPQAGLHLHQKIELKNGANVISVSSDKTDDDCVSMGNKRRVKSGCLTESGNQSFQCSEDMDKIENVDDCNDHHKFSIVESANSGVEFIVRNTSRQIVHDTAAFSDNVNVTSAVENLLSDAFVKSRAHNKAKYSNDSFSLREKRRRNRRDRRQARVRTFSSNEILPDNVNNHLPPPYADVPSEVIVPSINSTVPVVDNQYSFSLPLVRRSASDRYGKDCCDQWFNGPPLRFLVALVALGGVACTLGGATLGSIALAGSPTSHLTAGLLMTGVGIVLVTISMIAWRMTTSDNPQCAGRRQCTRGNSSFGLLYPEFQHRPPPPSYQNSIQQNRFREMMQNRERHAAVTRVSPPPTYRSNAGTLLSQPTNFPASISSLNYAQPEAIFDNLRTSASVNDVDGTSGTFPQTIKTITLISRLNDNELDELVLTLPDETSLIPKSSEINNIIDGMDRLESLRIDDYDDSMNETHHRNIKFSRSSRCSTETSSNTITNCNRNAVSTLDHNNHAYVKNCKNVHSGRINKTMLPITCSSSSTFDPMTISGRDCFVNVES